MATASHEGSCHCGAVAIEFRTGKPLAPRACACSFCRKHGVRAVSDPDGQAEIRLDSNRPPLRYRFGTETAEYVICSVCGSYIGAVMESGGGLYCVLNLNMFGNPHLELEAVSPSFEGESPTERRERRCRNWSPVELVIASATSDNDRRSR